MKTSNILFIIIVILVGLLVISNYHNNIKINNLKVDNKELKNKLNEDIRTT